MGALIIILAVFVTVATAQPRRNMHGNCALVINEVFFGRPIFVEIAKLCNDNDVHPYKKLGGHVLIVVNATENSILKTIWLHDKSLGPPIPHPAIPTAGENLQPTTAPEQFHASGAIGLSVQRYEQINCDRNPHCTVGRSERRRRSPERIQTTARFFLVVEMDEIEAEEFFVALFLLKLSDKDAKSQRNVRKVFEEGKELSAILTEKIQTSAVDALVLANSSTDYQQQLTTLLPASLHGKAPVLISEREVSYSKCDHTLLPMIPESFQASKISLWNPNVCNEGQLDTNVNSESDEEDEFANLPFKFKGMKLLRHAKQLVINTWFNIGVNDDPDLLSKNAVDVTAKLLNLGKTTVYDIIRQFKDGEKFSNSNKRNRACPVTDIEDEEKIILYKIITAYYKRNEIPKLRLMREEFVTQIKEHRKSEVPENDPASASESECDSPYTCCPRSFQMILQKNGYSYGRIRSKDAAVHAPYVIHNRHKYLKRKAEVDADSQMNLLFQDETWIDPHERPSYGWKKMPKFTTMENRYDFMFKNYKSSRGGRIVVLGIGGENGYINCATEVYKVSKSKTAVDYHANVNGQKFITWMRKVITCLPSGKKFVIVMDNCPFHNLKNAPDSKGRKDVFLTWLQEKKREGMSGIPANLQSLRRDQLWEVVKEVRNQIPAIIDDMVSKAGHEILRLPQYSPEMNPIEYAWKDLKHHVRDKNTKQDINDAVNLAKSYMESYGGDKWKKHIDHCKKVETMYREGDAEYDAFVMKNPDVQRLQPWEATDTDEDDFEFEDPDDSIEQTPLIGDSSFEASLV